MEAKVKKLYICPICKKEYRRKGFYLNKHLKQCGAIAWIPKIKYEFVMSVFESEKFNETINNLASGNFSVNTAPIERIRKSKKMTSEDFEKALAMKKLFEEFKEHPVELIHVPESELNHIYNVVVS